MPIFPLLVVVLGGAVDPEAALRPAIALTQLAVQPIADQVAAARRALDAHDFARAALLAAMASARVPAAAEPALVLGLARFRGGEPLLAIVPFTRAVAGAPSSATARFDLASALYQSGRFAEAERRYVEVERLDATVAPLARYDAALAALDDGHADRAAEHLTAAIAAARAAGQTALADQASALQASLAHRSAPGLTPEILASAHAAKKALLARHYAEAVDGYRRARDAADAAGASDSDRAELEYGLGHALYSKGDLVAAARALDAAVRLAPGEAEFPYLLGLVHFDGGADRDAQHALERAVALGLPAAEDQRARDILRSLKRRRPGDSSRFFVELRAGGGYDSNVPQSGIVVTTGNAQSSGQSAAMLEAAADLFWRPAGDARNGFSLEYRFDQLAYVSSLLDPYSLQEHDLTLSGAWTPTPRLTLELGAGGFLLFSGVQSFGSFETGASAGPRIIVRQGRGFETRLRYEHIWKFALDPQYAYLAGYRDEAGIAEHWRDPKDRITLGYQFADEAIGTQQILLGDLYLPAAAPAAYAVNDLYTIPYSYIGHEVALSLTRELWFEFRGVVALRYEHRSYGGSSFITIPQPRSTFDYRQRIDDRFGFDVSLRHAIGGGVDFELGYGLIINRSTIDNTRATTTLDYDDKNYVKQVVQLDFLWTY